MPENGNNVAVGLGTREHCIFFGGDQFVRRQGGKMLMLRKKKHN